MSKQRDRNADRRFPVLLREVWFTLNKAFRKRLRDTDLTPAQFTVLRWLNESGAGKLSQKDLAGLTASNPNNVADLIDRLEARGWVRRKKDRNDARRNVIWLTNTGRSIYEKGRMNAIALQEEVLHAFSTEEREHLLHLIARVNENLSLEKTLS